MSGTAAAVRPPSASFAPVPDYLLLKIRYVAFSHEKPVLIGKLIHDALKFSVYIDSFRLPKDRSANGTSASVGLVGRIMRSNRRSWLGGMRPDRGGAAELPIHAQGRICLVGADRP